MDREEIKNKIMQELRKKVEWIEANPNQRQQFQMGQIYALFPFGNAPTWEHEKILSVAREIIQDLENSGFLFEGQAGGQGSDAHYPWFTISEYGKEAFMKEDWLPYDPEGYVSALRARVPSIDSVTLSYVAESIAAYNRRHLLSATLTLGVASENLMLLLIEAYTTWLGTQDPTRQARFIKKTEDRFISAQYREFKKEFSVVDWKSLPSDLRGDWDTYLDGIFGFIRLNRNDAGHPTGRQFDAKVVYANLQIFAEYSQFIFKMIAFLR